MIAPRDDAGDRRILLLAVTRRDAELSTEVLTRAAMACVVCRDLGELCREIDAGAGLVIVPEEALAGDGPDALATALERQPPWSDLPVLVMSRTGADSPAVARAMDTLGNVTVIERPTRVAALVSAARAALRGRQRQYQIRSHLIERERAEEALRRSEVELRESDRRKDEFLAMLAHELRNPLAPIRNMLTVLRMTGHDDPAAARGYEMMDRQVQHLTRLVDDLLEMSRIRRGRIELRVERVDLAEVVRHAVETSRPLIDEERHRLEIRLPEEPLVLEGDPVRLAQAFANLLNNAARYTPAGGRIDVVARREGAQVVVSVRDDGVGISAEMLGQLFDMPTRAGLSASRGGLGIGLALTRRLVEMHGGTIDAHSEGPGSGSEFVVRLPLATGAPRAQMPPVRAQLLPPARRTPRRVLVVDDHRDSADSLGRLLELVGAEVRVVHDGGSALSALSSFRPEVVLLDLAMPGMDGYEVARRMRRHPELGNVTLIALTGWGQAEDRRRTRAAGFDRHLVKPADLATLQSLVAPLDRLLAAEPSDREVRRRESRSGEVRS